VNQADLRCPPWHWDTKHRNETKRPRPYESRDFTKAHNEGLYNGWSVYPGNTFLFLNLSWW